MTADPAYEQVVSAWAAHLVSGGATPWAAWVEQASGGLPSLLQPLPDAAHLELVRRINLAAGPGTGAPSGLAERVLSIASPGRGLVDAPLPWPGGAHRFGTPAVDPSALPTEELIRLATGVLTHLLPDGPLPVREEDHPPLPLPWRRRFRLYGAPATVAVLRRELLAHGLVESTHRATNIVVGLPVDVMVAEYWGSKVRAGGILKWATVWRRARAAGRLPAQIDVAETADRVQSRSGHPVQVVLAGTPEHAAASVADLLGVRALAPAGREDLARSDLLRRVNRLAGLTEGPDRVAGLAARLDGVLDELTTSTDPSVAVGPPVPPPLAPSGALGWARENAATTAGRIRRGGYPVHGDPEALAPTDHRLSGAVDRERTLELAVAACLRIWTTLEEGAREP